MMKGHAFFLLGILSTASIAAQDGVDQIWSQIDSIKHNTATIEAPARDSTPGPWAFNTMVGTSFGYVPLFGSAMNMFAVPRASYKANERLSFHGGLIVSQTLPVSMHSSEDPLIPAGMSNISAFASASYRLTENLTLHGTGIKSMANLPLDENRSALDYHDLSIGATYDFGNFSIGASFHRSDNSFYRSPFGYGNSFYGSPFRGGNGSFGPPIYW